MPSKVQTVSALWLTVLLFAFNPQPVVTLQLLTAAARDAWDDRLARLSSLDAPRLGEQVLPPEVLEVVQMVRGQQLTRLRVAASLDNDTDLQRLVEGLWPSKLEADAPDLFLSRGEFIPESCRRNEQGVLITHVYCG